MRQLTDKEMETYSNSLTNQGFVKEELVVNKGKEYRSLKITKRGSDYVNQFIMEKPEMFLLIFLDIMSHQGELNA